MRTEETTIDKMRLRPRFKMYTDISPQKFADSISTYLDSRADFDGNVNRETASIYVKTEHNSFWKPYLSLRSELEDGKTTIRGVFGPSSAVWTFFMFLYFLFAVLWMVFITLWFVGRQINIDTYEWALSVSFIMLLLLVLTWIATIIGQKKADSEMKKLRDFAIDSTLKFENNDA